MRPVRPVSSRAAVTGRVTRRPDAGRVAATTPVPHPRTPADDLVDDEDVPAALGWSRAWTRGLLAAAAVAAVCGAAWSPSSLLEDAYAAGLDALRDGRPATTCVVALDRSEYRDADVATRESWLETCTLPFRLRDARLPVPGE